MGDEVGSDSSGSEENTDDHSGRKTTDYNIVKRILPVIYKYCEADLAQAGEAPPPKVRKSAIFADQEDRVPSSLPWSSSSYDAIAEVTKNLKGKEAGQAQTTKSGCFAKLSFRREPPLGNLSFRGSYNIASNDPPAYPPPLSHLSQSGLHVIPPPCYKVSAKAFTDMEGCARMQATVASHLGWIVKAMGQLSMLEDPPIEDLKALVMAADRASYDSAVLAWHACSHFLLTRRDYYLDSQTVADDQALRSARTAPLGARFLLDDQVKTLLQFAMGASVVSLAAGRRTRTSGGRSRSRRASSQSGKNARGRQGKGRKSKRKAPKPQVTVPDANKTTQKS